MNLNQIVYHKNPNPPNRKAGFIKMKVLELDWISKEDVNYEIKRGINNSASAVTDGRRCYRDLKSILANHEETICEDKKEVSKVFPWTHIAISNAKKMCQSIHHSIRKDFMQNYLNEFYTSSIVGTLATLSLTDYLLLRLKRHGMSLGKQTDSHYTELITWAFLMLLERFN